MAGSDFTEVVRRAREIASFNGHCDASLIEGLEKNLRAFSTTPLTQQARQDAVERIVEDLATRMQIESFLAQHPEIEAQKLEGPILVTGLPRTGTTATVAMLALDPRFRFPRTWEMKAPLPPPVLNEEESDPRAIAARLAAGGIASSMHLSDPDGPEEDLAFMAGYDMRHYHGRFPISDEYLDWYFSDDFTSLYHFHERFLKLLQWRRGPKFWLLKAPPHLPRLKAFVARYPDSRIIMTHRDPVDAVCSTASFSALLYESSCAPGAVDKAWAGRRALDFWAKSMKAGLDARDELGEDRFIDLYNDDLVEDPIGTFQSLYSRLGLQIDKNLRIKLEQFHSRNARGVHGNHEYTAEEFGLTSQEIRTLFADYIIRFNL